MALQASNKFRKDLYYRLCSHHLHIPPLRERLNDLPLLVDHFLKMAAREFGKKTPSPPFELLNLLSNYTFPGNVRELKSMIFDAVANHTSKILSMERIESYLKKQPANLRGSAKISLGVQDSWFSEPERIPTLDQMTWDLMKRAMKRSGNNQSMAARFMGISRQRFGRYLKKYSEQN
jgi:DNA-binding NtrC family response regulator